MKYSSVSSGIQLREQDNGKDIKTITRYNIKQIEVEVTYSVPGYKESSTSTFTEASRLTGDFCPSISCTVPAPPADSREIGRIKAIGVTSG